MNRKHVILTLGAVLTLGAIGWAVAAEGPAILDPAKAGQDFAVQGEYRGPAENRQAVGAQVIALGDGKFEAVFSPGGLPGNRAYDPKARVRVAGKTEGDRTVFGTPGSGWSGAIANGKMEGQTDQGMKFTIPKINRKSRTLGMKPPAGALVLFDGTSTDAWVNGKKTEDGLLLPGTRTKETFGDFTLHVEFRTPYMPAARGQARGNSGVYVQDRYEIQVLDSFGLEGKDNECGGIYRQSAPRINACYPPLSWQTYDIDFQAARFDANGAKTKNAVVTVRHNGYLIHDRLSLTSNTPGGGKRTEDATPGAIYFQDHGNPVHFRNVWIVRK